MRVAALFAAFALAVAGLAAAWEFAAESRIGTLAGLSLVGSAADRWLDVALTTGCAILALAMGLSLNVVLDAKGRTFQERYRSLFERGAGGILIYDLDTLKISDANDKAREMFGYSRAELLAMTPYGLSADLKGTEAALDQLRQAGTRGGSWSQLMRHKDGRLIQCEVFAGLATGRRGRREVAVVILDVSARNAAQRALREQERRYRAVVENASDAIFVYDDDGNFLDVNRAACAERGFASHEVLAMNVTDVLAGVDPKLAADLRRRAADGEAVMAESRHRRKDGSEFPVEIHLSSYVDEAGRRRFVSIARDVTARLEAEDRLRVLSRAVEQNTNAIFITDLDARIEYVNAKFTELTGYQPPEVLGRGADILKSGDTPDAVYAELWRTVLSGREWKGEMKDRRKDGRLFWAQVSIMPVADHRGRISHFVAMHQDVTAQRMAQDAMRDARDQAEVASRAKTELLATMSHELRTPLNAVIGYAEALLMGLFGDMADPRQREYLGDIRASGEHLLTLINDILDVSAIEAGKVELREQDVDLAVLTESAIRLVRPRAERGRVHVDNRLESRSVVLRGDERRLKQVLLNLLSNAVKFTPEGGQVEVSARQAAGGDLVLAVADTGIGMDPGEIGKAMSLFGQLDSGLDRRYEGTGLGLPLVKGLVDLHGGQLEITSAKWQGTTISLTFPAHRVVAAVERLEAC